MSPNTFRSAATASILLSLLAACLDVWRPDLLPAALTQALQSEPVAPVFESLWLIGAVIGFALLLIASTVGLLLFKAWGRTACLFSTVLALGLWPFLGPSLMSGPAMLLSEASVLLWGAVLCAAYFSPVSRRFDPAA